MQFSVHGPVKIPVDRKGRILDQKQLTTDFWNEKVEALRPGLSAAKGCYIFSIRTSGSNRLMPWYVGKTNAQSFREECFKNHQRNHYSYALGEYEKAVPYMFFVSLLTATGKLSNSSTGGSETAINELEYFFISRGILRNNELRNVSDTAFFRDTVVPGFLNNEANPPHAAKELRRALNR